MSQVSPGNACLLSPNIFPHVPMLFYDWTETTRYPEAKMEVSWLGLLPPLSLHVGFYPGGGRSPLKIQGMGGD